MNEVNDFFPKFYCENCFYYQEIENPKNGKYGTDIFWSGDPRSLDNNRD